MNPFENLYGQAGFDDVLAVISSGALILANITVIFVAIKVVKNLVKEADDSNDSYRVEPSFFESIEETRLNREAIAADAGQMGMSIGEYERYLMDGGMPPSLEDDDIGYLDNDGNIISKQEFENLMSENDWVDDVASQEDLDGGEEFDGWEEYAPGKWRPIDG